MGAVATLTGEVRADGVGKTIDETTLLLPTDVHADPGECIVLRGPNGSGKTTLAAHHRRAARADRRHRHDRRPRGRRARPRRAGGRRRSARRADDLPRPDARSTTSCSSTRRGAATRRTSDDRAQALLDRLGIAHLHDRFPHELSSGQEQLFRLALTLARPATRAAARRAGAAARHGEAPGRRRHHPRACRARAPPSSWPATTRS